MKWLKSVNGNLAKIKGVWVVFGSHGFKYDLNTDIMSRYINDFKNRSWYLNYI